jgi:hypothetical protein
VDHHYVVGAVGDGQVAPVRLLEGEVGDAGGQFATLGQQDRRRVHAEDLAHVWRGRQLPADRPGAAADLEDARAGREGDVGEVARDHGLLLRVGRADLHDVGDLLDCGRVDFGDDRVHVRRRPDLLRVVLATRCGVTALSVTSG